VTFPEAHENPDPGQLGVVIDISLRPTSIQEDTIKAKVLLPRAYGCAGPGCATGND